METLLKSRAVAHVGEPAAGRAAGLQRLQEFLPQVPAYARERHFVLPGREGTSRLSPYVRLRLVRESEIVKAVLDQHAYPVAARFIDELCWRTYWKGYLEARPAIWEAYRAAVAGIPAGLDQPRREAWLGARAGRTGIACFDHWVEELTTTGWLHNHARMWFASIWIFTLELPWELGAAFMLEHLLDGDPAANTLGWRWVAGLHTPGKHYLARAETIRHCTGGQFFPKGQLNETAAAPAGQQPLAPAPLEPAVPLINADCPNLSDCPAGLLVCPEDLSPELGELAETPFSSICVLGARDVLDSISASARVRGFINGAVADTAQRLARHWSAAHITHSGSIPATPAAASPAHVGCRSPLRVHSGEVDQWVESVLAWAQNENLKSVSLLQPPVGPWREALPRLRSGLRLRNIRLLEYRRRWDALHWPHADGGYFRFRKGLRDRIRLLHPGA